MYMGGLRSAAKHERFKSADGFITADGLKLWNTVIAVGASSAADSGGPSMASPPAGTTPLSTWEPSKSS
jgi:hypothetical protein